MPATVIVQILGKLADVVGEIAPLFAQGQVVLSETDMAAVHAALTKAEQATATLRPQVDAALAQAAKT
jgi:hypothetical protein